MPLTAQPLSLDSFLSLTHIEESPAWEWMNGHATQKPMPTLYHSILQKRLVAIVDAAGSVYEAFPELRCVLLDQSIVPDVAVVQRDRLPTGNTPLQGAPDWIIEILSPDQNMTKLIEKIQFCLQGGARLGWLVDPKEQVILVFWTDRPMQLCRATLDPLPTLPDLALTLTLQTLFSGLAIS